MSTSTERLIPRKVWTRRETGLLHAESLSLELVNGELIDKTLGKHPPHNFWKHQLLHRLVSHFGDEYVRSEDPIDVAPEDNPTSEPEPDIAVTYKSITVTRGVNPIPEDLRLVVEVSDATFAYDTRIKMELYARARIREYWVLDVRAVNEPRLLVFRNPQEGRYQEMNVYTHDANIVILDGLQLCLANLM